MHGYLFEQDIKKRHVKEKEKKNIENKIIHYHYCFTYKKRVLKQASKHNKREKNTASSDS